METRVKYMIFGMCSGVLFVLAIVLTSFAIIMFMNGRVTEDKDVPTENAEQLNKEPDVYLPDILSPDTKQVATLSGHVLGKKFIPDKRYTYDSDVNMFVDDISDRDCITYKCSSTGILYGIGIHHQIDASKENINDVYEHMLTKYVTVYPGVYYAKNKIYITNRGDGISINIGSAGGYTYVSVTIVRYTI